MLTEPAATAILRLTEDTTAAAARANASPATTVENVPHTAIAEPTKTDATAAMIARAATIIITTLPVKVDIIVPAATNVRVVSAKTAATTIVPAVDIVARSEGFRRPAGGYRQQEGNENGGYQGGYEPRRGGYTPRPRFVDGNNAGNYGNRGGYSDGYSRGPQGGGYSRGSQNGGFRKPNTKRFNPGKQRVDYKEESYDPNQPIRLNKFLANAGVCSRRDADKYIRAGVVTVNGEIVTELGHKVLRSDTVLFHDQQVKAEKKIYVLLNKPKGYVTTSEDPQNRKTVMDLVRNACMERIYPVGRLDRNTTGVLLLTNDGEMASKLTHPKFMKKKIYHVYLDRNVTAADLHQIAEGITLEDGDIRADAVEYASETDRKQVGIEIHSGKNRIVRRIFAALGYNVIKLDRVYFAGLTKKNVKRGDWRYLTEEEVRMLRMGSFE